MITWLVVAPMRSDDDSLPNSEWVAQTTLRHVLSAPIVLSGETATRSNFERIVGEHQPLTGMAFFGHGAEDRLYDAERPPKATGPALLDHDNIGLLVNCWIHAFACWSGVKLAHRAVVQGVEIYVGYRRPLDVAWEFPPSAASEFENLVTATTKSLLAGERDEHQLQANAARAADEFVLALERIPEKTRSRGWIWLHALAAQLVDDMVVAKAQR